MAGEQIESGGAGTLIWSWRRPTHSTRPAAVSRLSASRTAGGRRRGPGGRCSLGRASPGCITAEHLGDDLVEDVLGHRSAVHRLQGHAAQHARPEGQRSSGLTNFLSGRTWRRGGPGLPGSDGGELHLHRLSEREHARHRAHHDRELTDRTVLVELDEVASLDLPVADPGLEYERVVAGPHADVGTDFADIART